MERQSTWIAIFCLSVVMIGASVDHFRHARSGNENFIIATASISLIFSFFFIAANLSEKLGSMILGNKVESVVSGLVLVLWIFAISFIQDPKYGAATDVNDAGQEIIIYANLFLFSWLNFVVAIYLFGNLLRDSFSFNEKFSQWVLLLVASVVLTATSVSLRGDICEKAGENACGRIKYALAVGALGIVFSLISILTTMFGFTRKALDIGTSALVSIFYFFGVVTLTSSSGPASTFGNMYFSLWAGCFCAVTLFIRAAFPNRGQAQPANNDDDQI